MKISTIRPTSLGVRRRHAVLYDAFMECNTKLSIPLSQACYLICECFLSAANFNATYTSDDKYIIQADESLCIRSYSE